MVLHIMVPPVLTVKQGYLPLPKPTRASTLARKRREYASLVETTFSRGREGLDQQIWHQIEIDVPRTRPGVPLWMQAHTQRVRAYAIHRCIQLTGRTEFRAHPVRLGHPPSGQRLRPGHQRPSDAVLPSLPRRIHRYVSSSPALSRAHKILTWKRRLRSGRVRHWNPPK